MTIRVQDYKGNELKVGTKVLYGAPNLTDDWSEYKAEVTAISEPDVVYNPVTDADDGGYEVEITIKFANGEEDKLKASFSSSDSRDHWEGTGEILEVFEEGGDLEVLDT